MALFSSTNDRDDGPCRSVAAVSHTSVLHFLVDPRIIGSTHPPRLYPARGMRNHGGFFVVLEQP